MFDNRAVGLTQEAVPSGAIRKLHQLPLLSDAQEQSVCRANSAGHSFLWIAALRRTQRHAAVGRWQRCSSAVRQA